MIITHVNYPGAKGEVNHKPSLTVPDQVPSLSEMLRRYVRGDDVQQFQPVYNEGNDELIDKLEKMDRADRIQAARDIKASIRAKGKQVDLEDMIAEVKAEKVKEILQKPGESGDDGKQS